MAHFLLAKSDIILVKIYEVVNGIYEVVTGYAIDSTAIVTGLLDEVFFCMLDLDTGII